MQINPQFPEHQHLNCPRCDSNNTKFCYYNNYNLSQPRHFCKNCKRYWTKGGILRNIPVGGGTRKITKRSSNPKKSHASPAPATSISPTTTTSSSLTAQSQPKLESSRVGAVDLDGRVVELGSRFSSRSQSGGQFGNFINMEAGGAEQPNSDESGMIETSPNEIRSNSNDSVSCLGYEWPGLSIVMPGSDFQ